MTRSTDTWRSLLDQSRLFVADLISSSARQLALAIVLALGAAVVEGIGITLLIPFIAVIAPTSAPAGGWVKSLSDHAFHLLGLRTPLAQLSVLLVIFAATFVLQTIFTALGDATTLRLYLQFRIRTQLGVVRSLAGTTWERVTSLKHARITHLLGSDVFRVAMAVSSFVGITVAVVGFGLRLAFAFAVQPLMTLISIAVIGAGVVLFGGVLRAARRLGEITTSTNLALLNNTGQFLGSLKLAFSQELQAQFVADFERLLNMALTQEMHFIRQRNGNRVQIVVVGAIAGVAVALLGFNVLRIPASVMIALLFLLSRLGAPVGQMQISAIEFVRNLPAYEQIKQLESEIAAPAPRVAHLEVPRGRIELRDVSYQHVDAETGSARGGLGHVSLVVNAHESLGLAGPSGAGKTTLADILVGLYRPQRGQVLVGGVDYDLTTIPNWRERLAYVSQDPFMSNGTVRANLLWANPHASDADIEQVVSLVEAEPLLRKMPSGMDTVLGERGALISGGERQRLALARALLRKPELLILDEATNALDIESERRLLRNLKSLRPLPTVVLVSHRLEALGHCDRIVILEAGRIVMEGSFERVYGQLLADRA